MKLGAVIKNNRKNLGFTQEQLAEKIFVSNKTISNWETGKTTPDIDSLIKLAHLLHFSLDTVLLEGSTVVKNIKKQAELKSMTLYSAITMINNTLFIMILTLTDIFGTLNPPLHIAIIIGMFLNMPAMLYFAFKLDKLQKAQSLDEKVKYKKYYIAYTFLSILCIITMISPIIYKIVSTLIWNYHHPY